MRRWSLICVTGALLAVSLPYGRAQDLSGVVRRVAPSVVALEVTGQGGTPNGSGVVVSADGKVMTAAHLVRDAGGVVVCLADGSRIGAGVVAFEPVSDVALLQLDEPPREILVAKLGDSGGVQAGKPVVVVARVPGAGPVPAVGYVAGRWCPGDLYNGVPGAEFLLTDARLRAVHAGGPVFDTDGDVVGIITEPEGPPTWARGPGLAVSSNFARRVLLERDPFWSGLSAVLLSGDEAAAFQIPPPGAGLLVQRVAPGSPAAKLGLRPGTIPAEIGGRRLLIGGDVILQVAGVPVGQPDSLRRIRDALSALPAGEKIPLTILRKGTPMKVGGQTFHLFRFSKGLFR